MYFHVTAALADPASARAFEAAGPTWRELRDERVIIGSWRCVDGTGIYLIVEAGDGDEARRSMSRLPWVLDGTVTLSVTAVEII
ncbi:hypothetical protein [Actinoplanes palleronii]|uniref:YCII-related domain-containing protein n=1 Tax=Actinoplanes palleronii TaxID=113570 RepID=A0ABQ4BGQ6_9ACTN|nr:hypothetical protein [Actinoplanes palleronii]GIE69460.1 hypothetical protein Apa02nite_055680 [Actinoplanes palleronii]